MSKEINLENIPVEKLKSLYRTLSKANQALHKKVVELDNELQVRKRAEQQMLAEKIAQDSIMRHTVKEFNAQKERLLQDNNLLREQITRLKDGSIDRLGNENNISTQG